MIPGSTPFDNDGIGNSAGSNQQPNKDLHDQGDAKKLERNNKFLVDNTIDNKNNGNGKTLLPDRQNILASNYPQSLYPYNQLYPQFYQYQYAPQFPPINQQFLEQQNFNRFNSSNMNLQLPSNSPHDPTNSGQFYSVPFNHSPNQGMFPHLHPSRGPQQHMVSQSTNFSSRIIPSSIYQQEQQVYPHPMVNLSMSFSENISDKDTGSSIVHDNNNIKNNTLQTQTCFSIPEQDRGEGTFSVTTSRRSSEKTEEEEQRTITEIGIAQKHRKPKIVHSCEVCGKIFKRKQSLQTHMNVHFNLRPFRCFICGKTFNAKQNYMRHERSHLKRKTSSKDRKKL